MAPRSYAETWPVARTAMLMSATRTRPKVAYGRTSGAMPGISSRRSRPSFGAFIRRPRRSRLRPLLSSFGARLRTRCPQYGHSVTYGLTSAEQFLQTTNRSGWLMNRGYPGPNGRSTGLQGGLLDDLGHDLAQIVVGLVDDQLPGAAVAAVE